MERDVLEMLRSAVWEHWLVGVPCVLTVVLTGFVARLATSRRRALAELHASRAALRDSEARFREFISTQKEADERIKTLAFFDGVTGLANRSLFVERLSQAIEQAERRNHPLAVLFLDLDGFKQVNDAHGHEVGDEVLALVAARFASSVRLSDQIGRLPDEMNISRFGGDEFTVLLAEVNGQQGAEIAARRLVRSLERPLQIDGLKIALGVSIGIAVYPDDGATVDALLRNADAAMYRAKREPGSAYRFHEAGTDS